MPIFVDGGGVLGSLVWVRVESSSTNALQLCQVVLFIVTRQPWLLRGRSSAGVNCNSSIEINAFNYACWPQWNDDNLHQLFPYLSCIR